MNNYLQLSIEDVFKNGDESHSQFLNDSAVLEVIFFDRKMFSPIFAKDFESARAIVSEYARKYFDAADFFEKYRKASEECLPMVLILISRGWKLKHFENHNFPDFDTFEEYLQLEDKVMMVNRTRTCKKRMFAGRAKNIK